MRLPRGRSSVSGVMGAVLACAVGLAALRDADEKWAGTLALLTWAFLGAALLGVIQARGVDRAGWTGFLVFAGGYSVLAFGPWFSEHVGSTLATTHLMGHAYMRVTSSPAPRSPKFQPLLDRRDALTAKLDGALKLTRSQNDPAIVVVRRQIASLDGEIAKKRGHPLPTAAPGGGTLPPVPPSRWKVIAPGAANYDQFLRVGHCVSAWLSGVIGAVISVGLYSKREGHPAPVRGTPGL